MSSEALEGDVTVANSAASVHPNLSAVETKIMADLELLMEKCDLCASMLRPGSDCPAPSVQTDDACQTVIGFLEACQPRMVELVEAAAVGAVSDTVLMKALEVNDRLTLVMADIDTAALTETAASTTAASVSADSNVDSNSVQDNLDDLLLTDDGDDGDDNNNIHGDDNLVGDDDSKKPAARKKSTGEQDEQHNDPFGNTVLQPTSASGAPAPASTKSEDEFDSFFNDRTTS